MITIHKTTDYGQFKLFIERNRPVLTDRVYNSVKLNNKLENNPILVTKDLYILDGQHRLDAARRLQVPIYYKIDPSGNEEDIAIYQKQTPWTMKDYLRYYTSVNSGYEFVGKLCETYKLLHNLTFVVNVCSSSETATQDFRLGTFKLKTSESILERHFSNLSQIINQINEINHSDYLSKNVLIALMSIICGKVYDHKLFMHKLKLYPDNTKAVLEFRQLKNLREGFLKRVYNFNSKDASKKISL
jgi:hypothetical protein